MKVKFTTNLGSREADELQIDPDKCACGAELDVKKAIGDILVERNRVIVLELPPVIQAVPAEPALAKAKPATTKPRKPTGKTAENKDLSADS